MDCPVCSEPMIVLEYDRVEVDYCVSCQGLWLDAGELELLFGDESACAAYLASEAALTMGSGLVTCAVPKSLNAIMERKLTEVMTLPVEDRGKGYFPAQAFSKISKFSKKVDAAVIGPGLTRKAEVKKLVKKLIRNIETPIVLDADGINCIADKPLILKEAKSSIVITPHPGEMSRLIKKSIRYIQKNRKEIAAEVSHRYGVVVVLKGKGTVVASGKKRIYVNTTGNPGMASGGVGDVLTGMIASLIGQGCTLFDAARFSVFLHGLAGDIAAKKKGVASLRAQDIIDGIPTAIKKAI